MSGQEPVQALYITDEPAADTQLPALLTDYGPVNVTKSTTRTAALDTLTASSFDRVLLAADPADRDFSGFLEKVRDHDPAVPIIAAPEDTDVDPEGLPPGITEYLPPSVDDLVRRDLLVQRIETLTDPSATPPTRYSALSELISIATDPSVSFDTALQHATETLSQLLPVAFVSVFEYHDDGLRLRDRYDVAATQHTAGGSTMVTCPTDTIADFEGVVPLAALPATVRDSLAGDGPGVAAPIWIDDELVGLLVGSGTSFSPAEEMLFEHGADVLSWCFRRRSYADRVSQIEEQNEKIRALHQVAADLDDAKTPDSVYEMIIDAAESILEFDVAIADAVEDGVLIPKAVSSHLSEEQYYDETPIDHDDSVAAAVYQSGETSLVTNTNEADAVRADTRFLSLLTISIGEYGVFQAAAESVNAFDETDLELAELLVTHGRDRLRQLEQTQQLEAYTDTLERQNERLDAFASVVSHDLRNPLQVAIGNLQRIKTTAPDDPVATAVDELDKSLNRMESLIDDLLTLATEGELVDSLEPTSIAQVAEDAWATVPTATATLTVETDLEVTADGSRLQQLFENLFVNAIDHGGPDVAITVGELPNQAGFFVADDGPGIDPDARDVVFEHGYTTSTEGTGVGLEIVADIVAAHDWTITATESHTGGAQFEITGVDAMATDREPPSD